MFERFTSEARAVVVGAQEQARRLGSTEIDAAHLVLAIVAQGGAEAEVLLDGGLEPRQVETTADATFLDPEALASVGIDLDAVRRRADEVFGPGALDRHPRRPRQGHIPFTREAKKVLELALREAIHLGDREIRTEHLALGLARPQTASADLLRRSGADPVAIRAAVLARRAAA